MNEQTSPDRVGTQAVMNWEKLIETEPTVLPIIDIIESIEDYQIKVYMPGVKKENIFLKLEDDLLTVFGKVDLNNIEDIKFILREKSYGHYFRRFHISDKIDGTKISARMDNGLLNIILPKHERIKPKEISIN